jgi:general secretion pathway protein F
LSLFAYEAVNAKGRREKGEVEADSERSARQLLKSRQLVVRQLSGVEEASISTLTHRAKGLKGSETTTFLQQLSTLTAAGMPLVEALGSIAEGMERRQARHVVAAVRQQVVEGGSLADALSSQGLEEVVCNMVAAGEETGQLEAVASRLADLLEHRQQLGQELLSATLYPVIILGFGLIVMLFLLAVVVPQIVTVFERTGGNLPELTKIVIALSAFLRDYGLLLLVAAVLAALGYLAAMRHESIRYRRDLLLLQAPGIGSLLAKIETARFGHTLGMLLTGGVPALPAMHIANQSFTLLPMREVGEFAREQLREGGSIAEGLKRGGFVPYMAIRLIAVGEASGTLDTMLIKVAENYEREASRNMKRLLTILEPALVMFMALMVGALALAILLPIIEMNELVR